MLTKFQEANIPDWAFKEMMLRCKHCSAYIAQNENLTARWCPNRRCPGHMAYKLEDLAKYFGVKGMGPATALSIIKERNLQSHFDAIPLWFKDKKPMIRLGDIAALAGIDGYGKVQAERDFASYRSFTQFFSESPNIHPLLYTNKDMLISAEKYFTVLPPLASSYINVMGTGHFHGYNSRDDYFQMVNMLFGEYLHIIQCGKRKTNVAFLLQEHDAPDKSKAELAAQCGIPVVTPLEFIQILCAYFHMSIEDIKKKGESFRQ